MLNIDDPPEIGATYVINKDYGTKYLLGLPEMVFNYPERYNEYNTLNTNSNCMILLDYKTYNYENWGERLLILFYSDNKIVCDILVDYKDFNRQFKKLC